MAHRLLSYTLILVPGVENADETVSLSLPAGTAKVLRLPGIETSEKTVSFCAMWNCADLAQNFCRAMSGRALPARSLRFFLQYLYIAFVPTKRATDGRPYEPESVPTKTARSGTPRFAPSYRYRAPAITILAAVYVRRNYSALARRDSFIVLSESSIPGTCNNYIGSCVRAQKLLCTCVTRQLYGFVGTFDTGFTQ